MLFDVALSLQAQWDAAGQLQAEKEKCEQETREKAAAVFAKLDLDGNGWLDVMELKRFFRKIAGDYSRLSLCIITFFVCCSTLFLLS